MKIHSIEYSNDVSGLNITRTSFDNLTLLVGVSGVGKTLILRSIYKMIQWMADRKPRGLDAWGDKFSTNARFTMAFSLEDNEYVWSFQTRPLGWSNSLTSQLTLESETLTINGKPFFTRQNDTVEMEGFESLPKIAVDRSVLSIFKSEPKVRRVNEQLKQVFLFEADPDLDTYLPASELTALKRFVPENYSWFINDVSFNCLNKLAVLAYIRPDILDDVKLAFSHVFPTVTDIKAEVVGDIVLLAIKENDRWIYQHEISRGMLKTLAHIVYFKILPPESVLLIDELENSLGINCIDCVVDEIVCGRKDIQFIITSHHPYIINNIPASCWKIVQRKNSTIAVSTPESLDIGVSSQDSFFQLMNALDFNGNM